MKNILIPINFSENCTKAAQLGIEMAKLYNSVIHFLHLRSVPNHSTLTIMTIHISK
jgi:hypothetical protein